MPFSVWLGRLVLDADIRQYGDDRNPGAANAWRAGKWRVGLPALVLDFLKGALPVGLAHFGFKITGWELVPIALAPVFGHAFTPFLKFRGGKALAVTFGVWTGILPPAAPLILGIVMGGCMLLRLADAWAVVAGMLGLLVFLIFYQPAGFVFAIWVANLSVLILKNRRELRQAMRSSPRRFARQAD